MTHVQQSYGAVKFYFDPSRLTRFRVRPPCGFPTFTDAVYGSTYFKSQRAGGTTMVMLALAYFADRGICNPSVETIAAHSNVGERAVQIVLRKLREDGVLRVATVFKDNLQQTNCYVLSLDEDDEEPSPSEEPVAHPEKTVNAQEHQVVNTDQNVCPEPPDEKQESEQHDVYRIANPDSPRYIRKGVQLDSSPLPLKRFTRSKAVARARDKTGNRYIHKAPRRLQ